MRILGIDPNVDVSVGRSRDIAAIVDLEEADAVDGPDQSYCEAGLSAGGWLVGRAARLAVYRLDVARCRYAVPLDVAGR